MTKQEVLQDIDKLCGDIDNTITSFVSASENKDFQAIIEAKNNVGILLVDARQELSFLRDYIEENVKDE